MGNGLPRAVPVVGLLVLALVCCTAPATPVMGEITIESVKVETGKQIAFRGNSTLPEGYRLQTQLLEDGKAAGWWPEDTSVGVAGGVWSIVVPLGVDERPEALDPAWQYVLHVWPKEGAFADRATFAFDVAPPPMPDRVEAPPSPTDSTSD